MIVISFLHFKVYFYKHLFLNKRKYLTVPPGGFFTLNTMNSLATQGVFLFPFLLVCFIFWHSSRGMDELTEKLQVHPNLHLSEETLQWLYSFELMGNSCILNLLGLGVSS